MKFNAIGSVPLYLSQQGPPPPPLAAFDVYYDSYPKVGFTVIGSASGSEAGASPVFDLNQHVQLKDESRYGEQHGQLEGSQPMRQPDPTLYSYPAAPVRPRFEEARRVECQARPPAQITNFTVESN